MLKSSLCLAVLLCVVAVHGQSPFSRCKQFDWFNWEHWQRERSHQFVFLLFFSLIGANLPNPQAISFNQCRSPQQFCQVERNMRVLSRVQFAPAQRVNRLTAHAELCRNGGCIEWPLGSRSVACNYLLNDARCPLNAQTSYTFELRGRFPTAVPLNTPIHVYLRVRDADRGTVLSCFRTLVTVTR